MGAVLEKAADMPLDQMLKKYVTEPLEMEDTDFYVPQQKQDRLAQLYEYAEEAQTGIRPALKRQLCLTKCLEKPSFLSGGAGLVSTLSDYSRFAMMLAGNGRVGHYRLLREETMDRLVTAQVTEEQIKKYSFYYLNGYLFGNFVRIMADPKEIGSCASKGEFGWDGYAGGYLSVDREKNMSIVSLVQVCEMKERELFGKVRDKVYL